MSSTTMTLRLPNTTKSKLERLAEHTNRSLSFLAGQAIADYAERELAIVEGIEEGLDDERAGRVISHDDALLRISEAINEASKG